jgi:glycosyltransferase involved in cell wall biosynthesis
MFVAANQREGMCAPTAEAMIAGTPIVCWTGGGPDEYLVDRAVIATQDDVESLRTAIAVTARSIDRLPEFWAESTRAWSDWFQATYSREQQVDEICQIMRELL